MSGFDLVITLIIAIIIIIVAISKFKVHAFLALIGVSILMAIVVGIPLTKIADVIGAGFSGTFTSIGIVIIFGALVGIYIEKTGGAIKIADAVIKLVGKRNPELAMLLMGWVVSIPVFCDSGFVILDPIRRALQKRTMKSSVAMTVSLSAGLYIAHVFIPPTPGPIAAAGNVGLGDNLLLIIGVGTLVSIPCLISGYFFAKYIGKKVKSREDMEGENVGDVEKAYKDFVASYGKLPSTALSFAPIIVPIILMAIGSIASILKWSGFWGDIFLFMGKPIIALAGGVILGIILLGRTKRLGEFYEMTNETLKVVGPILFVTAAGGVLGKVITEAGFVGYIQENAQILSSVGIFFPFLIAAILKVAQGSSTVAITTTSGILGSFAASDSMMAALGLNNPLAAAFTVMAVGAGAMTVSHANDSYFWVVTNFGRMKPQDGYKTQTMVTLVMGVTAIVFIWILSLFMF